MSFFQLDGVEGSTAQGPCEKASRGQSYSSCEIDCNVRTGECEEIRKEETCGCDGNAFFADYYMTCRVSTHNYCKSESNLNINLTRSIYFHITF